MRTRKLEEILEECLSAYLEDGRSVEDSLRMYSAYRGQLEPLLRTALDLTDTFQSYAPPEHVQERGLARFLSDARARKNLRTMTAEPKRGFFANLFAPQRRTALAGMAVAAVVISIAVGAAAVGGSSDDRDGTTNVNNPPTLDSPPSGTRGVTRSPVVETPATVRTLQDHLDTIRNKVAIGQTPSSEELVLFTAALNGLGNDPAVAASTAETTLREADTVLQTLVDNHPEVASDPAVIDAQETTRNVAGGLGINLNATPTPPPTAVPATDQPAVTPTDAPTGDTETPAPTTPATDTPPPTDVPTSVETPTTRPVGLDQ